MKLRQARLGRKAQLDDSVLATGIPFADRPGHAQFFKELQQVTPHVSDARRFGSAALDLAWVVAGRFDGYWDAT